MNFLPYENFELYTNLSADEVFYRLRANVDTKRKWLFFTNKPYWGKVERDYFKIWRSTWWNQNSPAIVIGNIRAEELGSCVSLRIRIHWVGFIFWLVWLTGIWVIFFLGISNLIVQKIQTGFFGIDSPLVLFAPIIMFLFGYGTSVGIFMWKAQDVKKNLFQLLETNEENMKPNEKIFGLTEPQILKVIFLTTFIVSFGWILYNLFLKPRFSP